MLIGFMLIKKMCMRATLAFNGLSEFVSHTSLVNQLDLKHNKNIKHWV